MASKQIKAQERGSEQILNACTETQRFSYSVRRQCLVFQKAATRDVS